MGYRELVRRLGHRRWFARLGRALTPVDRALHLATRGRWGITGRDQLQQLVLTTTGRSTGLPRDAPLLYAEDGDGWVVVASNWGREHHPAWSANLLASPDATVTLLGRRRPVRATLLDGAERERAWPLLIEVWPAYDSYAARTDRGLRVFRLEPRGDAG